MPRTPNRPPDKEKAKDILETPRDKDLADVQSDSADFERNKSGPYGGLPEARRSPATKARKRPR